MIAITESPSGPRFTLDGSEALEVFLRESCEKVLRSVQDLVPPTKLHGLLLAGGYGRGEGGVLQGHLPYNDLDFYVFLEGNHRLNLRAFGGSLHHLAEELSRHLGIEVELKLDSLARWRRSPVTMFSYDVLLGHKWILGHESLFAGCEHHRRAEHIPTAEGARLLLNRCSGLLFAAEHLRREEFPPASADFVARNIAKAQLGLGDAVLTMHRLYHWSCRERHARLKHLAVPWDADLRSQHATGVEFKLHPTLSAASRAELRSAHREITALAKKVWLWLESRRLGVPYDTVRAYAEDRTNKCPETPAWRNLLVNLTTCGTVSLRYPREQLFRKLSLLLWDSPDSENIANRVRDYQTFWRRFN